MKLMNTMGLTPEEVVLTTKIINANVNQLRQISKDCAAPMIAIRQAIKETAKELNVSEEQ